MRDISSFRKALWCGAAATVLLFVGFAAVLPPGGNYAGMLGALTAQCFMPALLAGWIASRGRQPRGWATVATIYVVAFLVISGFSALGGDRRAAAAAPAPAAPAAAAAAAAAADMAAPVETGGAAVVATVDGIPITKAAVARAYRQRLARYLTAGPVSAPIYLKFLPLDVVSVFELIDHQIALGEVRRLGIDVTPADVHARLATMPLFLQGGSYIGEARALDVLARHYPWLPREAVFEKFRLEMAIERLEAVVTRGLAPRDRLPAYRAAIDRARSLARITVDDALLSQIVRETP